MIANLQSDVINVCHKDHVNPQQSERCPYRAIRGFIMMGKDHYITKVHEEGRGFFPKLWQFDTRTTALRKLYAAYLKTTATATKSEATAEVIS